MGYRVWALALLLVGCSSATGVVANDVGHANDDAPPETCASACPFACVDGACAPAIQIVAGGFRTCARTRGGAVYCWGSGPSDPDASLVPRRLPNVSAIAMAAGSLHTCVATSPDSGATVLCWGDNTHGQLGDGTTTAHGIPDHGMGWDLFDIVAGDETTWVRTITGAYAWGANDRGQLGDGSHLDGLYPHQSAHGPTIVAGSHHACALEMGDVQCWGRANWGQLGDGALTHETCAGDVAGPIDCSTSAVRTMFPAGEVFAGGSVTCVIDSDRHAWCAGWNVAGQLGDGATHGLCGTDDCSRVPVRVPALEDVTQIAIGTSTTCFLSRGHVYCAGEGALGDGVATHGACPHGMRPPPSSGCATTPVEVAGLTDATFIAGRDSFFAIRADGSIVAWGPNTMGILGDGTTTDRSAPVPVRVPQ